MPLMCLPLPQPSPCPSAPPAPQPPKPVSHEEPACCGSTAAGQQQAVVAAGVVRHIWWVWVGGWCGREGYVSSGLRDTSGGGGWVKGQGWWCQQWLRDRREGRRVPGGSGPATAVYTHMQCVHTLHVYTHCMCVKTTNRCIKAADADALCTAAAGGSTVLLTVLHVLAAWQYNCWLSQWVIC